MKILSRLRHRTWMPALVASGLLIGGCSIAAGPGRQMGEQDSHEQAIALATNVTVFRSPTCGCCGLWIEHMRNAGFEVKDEITEDMADLKQQYGVPTNMASCHTTVVTTADRQYVVEGHIPAQNVAQLLTDQPDVAGIAVPGMPIGSPGMESGDYVEPCTVFSFTETGETATFAQHGS